MNITYNGQEELQLYGDEVKITNMTQSYVIVTNNSESNVFISKKMILKQTSTLIT